MYEIITRSTAEWVAKEVVNDLNVLLQHINFVCMPHIEGKHMYSLICSQMYEN